MLNSNQHACIETSYNGLVVTAVLNFNNQNILLFLYIGTQSEVRPSLGIVVIALATCVVMMATVGGVIAVCSIPVR